MFGSDLKQLIVLDDIRDKLDMVDSDIVPESCTHPVVTGIENTPSNISSIDGSSYQGSYTTFPLSPLQGRVHYIKDSFINVSINVNFGIAVASNVPKDIVLAVGPRDTASIFNQIQFMIDNNPIWTTTYQHIESAIDLAGLPASVVDHSPNYATIDKLLHCKQTPMQFITIPAGDYATAKGSIIKYALHFDFSIDLNRLSVPLSNLRFITSNMGNLRLRCYFNNFQQSFFVMQMPAGFTPVADAANASIISNCIQASSLLSLDPISWGSASKDSANKWTMTNPYMLKALAVDKVTLKGTAGQITSHTFDYSTPTQALIPIQFILKPADQTAKFMEVTVAQICQTCFDLKEESYMTLCEYFKQTGKVIIPIQAWSTAIFNNGTVRFSDKASVPTTLIANVPGNNITAIAVTAVPTDAQTCLINPYLSQFQALLDGKTLNVVPYNKVDNRAIQDFTNACIDTDHEEINTDYLYSLQFPQFYADGTSTLDDRNYFYGIKSSPTGDAGDYELKYFSTRGLFSGISAMKYEKNPNLFMYVFQTAIPDSFHTGMCIIEFSNRQALFRFTSAVQSRDAIAGRFYDARGTTVDDNNAGTVAIPNADNSASIIWPSMPNITNKDVQFNVSCLCDQCIVLEYSDINNTCTGGYLSYAKPYVQ